MKLFLIKKYIGITIFFVLFFVFCLSQETKIKLEVTPGQIKIGAPSYLNLGQINLTQTQQEVQSSFNDYFWVSDLQGSDQGYSTNIQSNGLYGINGVVLTGIYLKAGNSIPTLILGNPGNVSINPDLQNYMLISQGPVTYIYRPIGSNLGTINKYGDMPSIKVIVPAFIQPGTYSGTIYFDI